MKPESKAKKMKAKACAINAPRSFQEVYNCMPQQAKQQSVQQVPEFLKGKK